MEKKRVAMISYHTCPLASKEGKETGGMNIYVLELSKELAKQGHRVDIFTRSQDINHEHIVNVTENLRVIHTVAGPEKNISKKKLFPYMDEFVKNFCNFVKKDRIEYDILHCHYYLSGLIGLRIKKKINIPLIMTFHTLALMKNLVARSQEEKEGYARVQQERLLTKHADKIITSSEIEALYMEYLYNSLPSNIEIVSPGIHTKRFHPIDKKLAKQKIHVNPKRKVVLFVGRIEPLKGIDTLMYAMKILVTHCPNMPVNLMIVGGDVSQKKELWAKELKKLEELRRILQIPNIVTFVGQRTQEELPYYYNAAEVLVMPSHYESFGIAALEAMGCGTPVITSNVAGVASIIDEAHGSLITTVNNPLLLASQIEHLLLDEKEHNRLSKILVKSVSNLTWENTAKRISKYYEEY